jgi:hypothetical protein
MKRKKIYHISILLYALGQGVRQFGRWCLFAFFGVFGRREILGVLKTWRIRWRILLHRFYICCIFGRRLFCHLCLLAFLIFLFVFLYLLRRFLVYTSSVLRGPPYTFIKFYSLIKLCHVLTFERPFYITVFSRGRAIIFFKIIWLVA